MASNLRNFVSDQLNAHLGYSEDVLVDFIISSARKGTAELENALSSAGLPAATRRSLAATIRSKFGAQPALTRTTPTSSQAALVQGAHLSKMNKRMAFVGESEAEIQQKKLRKQLRKRKKKEEGAREQLDRYEAERREREEFEERVAMRDLQKKSAALTQQSSVQSVQSVNEAKVASRWQYLEKREKEKLAELEMIVADEERMFGDGRQLTEAERKRHAANKELLRMAKLRAHGKVEDDGYRFLDVDDTSSRAQKEDTNTYLARYKEDIDEAYVDEQEQWEADRVSAAGVDGQGKQKRTKKTEEYDELLMENEIDFILQQVEKGDKTALNALIEPKKDAPVITAQSTMKQVRESLPVFPYRQAFIDAVKEYQVLIVVGETGSGKTTQLTQYLHEAGLTNLGKIGCTQPRRVAAMSVAKRVSDEMSVKLGNEVGYQIRFEDCTSERTKIMYMTDGMLLRHFLSEPDLKAFSCIMIDEAHERTLHTDILFGLLKDLARFRKDLRLIISSATLEASKFSQYFDGAPVFVIPGRRYPVDILHTQKPEPDYVEASIITALQIHLTQPLGDVLIFLTGQDEVDTAAEALMTRSRALGSKARELIVARIYATLPSDMQAKIFEPTPPGARKVVIATNIAETSLTIPGIVYVIDAGFSKMTSYNPRNGMESLIVTPISKAMAKQRMGRAGRVSAGKCFRLYTEWAYEHELEENTKPEIQRTNLGSTVLLLKSLGIDDLIHFDFLDPPPAETLIRALEQLYALGALNDRGELTKLGRRMAEIPAEPELACTLLASENHGCVTEVLSVIAMLSVNNAIFYRPRDKLVHSQQAHQSFWKEGGDHMTLLNVYNSWKETGYSQTWTFEHYLQYRSLSRARAVREQLVALCDRVEVPLDVEADEIGRDVTPEIREGILKSITAGFFYNTAQLQKTGSYRTLKHRQSVQIHPGSCLYQDRPRWVVYNELVFTSTEFMRNVIAVKPQWLSEIAPHFFSLQELKDDSKKKVPKMIGRSSITK